ncbi:MAG: hypothetical protein JWM80_1795 [Cyanobacteria bacterium RYN_339]|nr:hypothetical protein [Cyanobacteria bacterium RYN_339]
MRPGDAVKVRPDACLLLSWYTSTMLRTITRMLAPLLLLAAAVAPAEAVVEVPTPKWMRPHGIYASVAPADPEGWRIGPTITSPFAVGVGLAYLVPLKPFTLKGGADWGITTDAGVTALTFQDWRLYAATMYYLVPGANDGPYVEVGLDATRSHGGVLALANWPVVPHLGFGTILRTGNDTNWDINFSATGNGLITLEGGILFGAPDRSGAQTPAGDD